MLVWINGPFGGGKTQSAHELHRRLVGSVICDPENVGFGLHRMSPPALRRDFQDLTSWRQGVHEILDQALREHPGTVIVPMTLIEPSYFDEIIGRLRLSGHDVRHFALVADREVVLQRLRERVVGHLAGKALGKDVPLRRESFAVAKLDLCLEHLADSRFAEHIHTDDLTISDVADHIGASAGLVLAPNTDGAFRRRIRHTWTGVRHIRLS